MAEMPAPRPRKTRHLEELIGKLEMMWSRVSGFGMDAAKDNKTSPVRSGLSGEMQDLIDYRRELQNQIETLLNNMSGVV